MMLDRGGLVEGIRGYLSSLDDRWFAEDCFPYASILLSGSTGWGIPEGFDASADWDIHVILDGDHYKEYIARYGSNHVIDDHDHDPVVFVQIRDEEWLINRLNQKDSSIVYLWLYENGTWITDSLGLSGKIAKYREAFDEDLVELVKSHFITFSVKRLDASSSAKRGLSCAMGMYKGSAAEAALRVFCLCQGHPYPYDKWLPRQVHMLGGSPLVELCEKCLNESGLEESIPLLKDLRGFVEELVRDRYGEQRWISHWWEYNEN